MGKMTVVQGILGVANPNIEADRYNLEDLERQNRLLTLKGKCVPTWVCRESTYRPGYVVHPWIMMKHILLALI